MKIAWFTPLNPIKSGISDYSEDLLPYISEYADVDVYIDNYKPNVVIDNVSIYEPCFFRNRHKYIDYDFVIYHMGNNPYHHYMYPFLLDYPGIVVLHDPIIHHFYSTMTFDKGKAHEYIDEMVYNYGDVGKTLGELRVKGIFTDFQQFLMPLNKRIIEQSRGVIVHSKYYKSEIERSYSAAQVATVPMGIPRMADEYPAKHELKELMGIDQDTFVIGVFGFIEHIKRPELIIKAFERLLTDRQKSLLLFVGERNPTCHVEELVSGLGLKKNVKITGRVSMEDFHRHMAMVDIGVSLRYPTAGETSAAVLRLLGMGKPVIVFNYRQFAELPDSCCPKVNPGCEEEKELSRWFLEMSRDPDLVQAMGDFAKEYIRRYHSLQDAAKGYIGFMEQVKDTAKIKTDRNLRKIIDEVSDEWPDFRVATSVRCILVDTAQEMRLF